VKSKREKEFNKLFSRLPRHIQNQAKEAYRLFKANPYYPSLHFKCIDTQESIYSVRVGRNYRVVGVWKGDTIYWFWIGSHEDYNNLF
jgi:hypothetical protein